MDVPGPYEFIIISPETRKLLPIRIIDLNDTFESVINILKEKGIPSNLIYYNGTQASIVDPSHRIKDYLPFRRYQVTFWAASTPDISNFPKYPDSINTGKETMLLLMVTPDYSLAPLLVHEKTKIETIISELKRQYQLNVRIIKLVGAEQENLSLGTIGDHLPTRTDQILLWLNDQTAITNQYAYLNNLPDELILEIIQYLPVEDIISICLSSMNLTRFCDDSRLWKKLVEKDYGLKTKSDDLTWKKVYSQRHLATYSGLSANILLIRAVTRGNMSKINSALKAGATNYNYALILAEDAGQDQMVKLLSNKIKENVISAGRVGRVVPLSVKVGGVIRENRTNSDRPPVFIDVSLLLQNGAGARRVATSRLGGNRISLGNLPIASSSVEKYAMALNMLNTIFPPRDRVSLKKEYLQAFNTSIAERRVMVQTRTIRFQDM